jgi:DNA repair exonuclease SbcCD ATPase subunit
MSIVFSKLRWKNFLSTGNVFTEIDLKKSNTTLIVGENGAGKSTILDALSFALYGKPFRKINKPQLLNSINNKSLIVEVEFETGKKQYRIIRGMKPNLFEIFQDNVLINQNAETKEYQETLEKHILKLNHKSFSQIVILGSASFTPFMQLPAAHRREVIEDLLDIQIFSTMNTLLKGKMQQTKEELMTLDMNIALTEQKIDLHKANLQNLRTNNLELISSYQEKIDIEQAEHDKLVVEQKNLTEKMDELVKTITDKEKNTSRLRKIQQLNDNLIEKKLKIANDISFYHDNDNCPTCKQELQVDFKLSKMDDKNKQLVEIDEAILKLEDEKKVALAREAEIHQVENEVSTYLRHVVGLTQKINICQATIQSLKNNIMHVEKQSKKIEEDASVLDTLNEELKDHITSKNELAEHRNLQEIASIVLKDNGIKTKIIKQYIPIMNKLINKYLASMDFFVNFELNESFEEKIKSRYRDEFSYESFSEGEKLRIDLALLFTWRAIAKLRNSASTNLLIMDEIFDSSLDNSGTEEFLKILQTFTQDTNVFVISHKGDSLYDKFHSVIKFEKKKNFSKIAA